MTNHPDDPPHIPKLRPSTRHYQCPLYLIGDDPEDFPAAVERLQRFCAKNLPGFGIYVPEDDHNA